MIAAFWKNDLRHFLILLNFIAFSVMIVYLLVSVLSPKRVRREEREAPNIVPFLPDEDLEGRRLERVQGWALIFAAVIAIALPIYWLREPNRQHESVHYFDEGAVNRGAVLFANNQMPAYDQAKSLQCANCHGTDLGGGGTSVSHIFKDKSGAFITWRAPALNTVLQRFSADEVNSIITNGRPGTPMRPSPYRAMAMFRPVWPPSVGSTASGRSRSMIAARTSGVSGSMYVASAKSGSVMIVAGLELARITR